MPDGTHSEDCWQVHHECAVQRIRALENQLASQEAAERAAVEAVNRSIEQATEHLIARAVPLYCLRHLETHTFTVSDVERIVYVLDVERAEAVAGQQGKPADPVEEHIECLREILRWSRSQELYAEHVNVMVERRQLGAARAAGGERRG